jgi:putative transposase
MRKRYDAAFMAKVVLEALRKQGTLAESGNRFEIRHSSKPDNPMEEDLPQESSRGLLEEKERRNRSPEEARIGTLPPDRPAQVRGRLAQKNLRSSARSRLDRRKALEQKNKKLSLRRQCELLGLNRSDIYVRMSI